MVTTLGKVLNKIKSSLSSIYMKVVFLANSVYVNSTLLATCLFDKYQNGTLEEQKEIISGIQQVFDGIITVEDLLTAQGITLEQSKDTELIKKHI